MHTRRIIIDMLLLFAVTVLAVVTAYVVVVSDAPQWLLMTALSGLTLVAMGSVVARFVRRPDHLRAQQSHKILEIANESLGYLRKGLNEQTAGAVCRIILVETEVAAVAITDTDHVLGFAGTGESHHSVGGPIITRATQETLRDGKHRILYAKEEIGCPSPDCLLRAAIVVPLEQGAASVGTLKFYYTTPRLLNETQVTLAEGLAKLLSTQLELAELERQTRLATRMELKALQAQINPHFLFNTINTIAMMIRTDPDRARDLLRQFAAFYRRTLEAGDQLITLDRELEYVRQYLLFECARFGDRIRVSERVAPDLLGFLVPAFVLQPLVENAVKHGMRSEKILHIALDASKDDGHVLVSVADDGVGIKGEDLPHVLEPGFGKGLGIALKNVDDRLKGYFGGDSGLVVQSWEGEGTIVTMQIARSGGPGTPESEME
ncbi:MAG: histidine kinase [Coriobacteriia bacterium]|nr:histidine kinase [Coriobacteriia bacterium]